MLRKSMLTGFLAIFVAFSPGLAVNPDVGTSAFSFLKIGMGARPMAMGGAYAGVSDDGEAIHWNPAGLVFVTQRQASITYVRHVEGVQVGSLVYIHPWRPGSTLGATLDYLSAGEMTQTDQFGSSQGTFGAWDLALAVSYARRLSPAVSLGATTRILLEKIQDYQASGLAADLGLTYRPAVPGLLIGASLQNLGQKTNALISEKEPLPLNIRVGAGYKTLRDRLTLALDLCKPNDNRFNYRLGAEYRLASLMTLRTGYNSLGSDLRTTSQVDLLAGTSFGLGFKWRTLNLDYAFLPYLDLGESQRVSLAVPF